MVASLDSFRGVKEVKERCRLETVLSQEQLGLIEAGSPLKGEALSFAHLEKFFIEETLAIPFRESGLLKAIHQASIQQEDRQVAVWAALSQDNHLHLFEAAGPEVVPPLFSFRCA